MKTVIGKVTSNKMKDTVTIMVETLWEHPVYKIRLKRSTKYHAHTEKAIKEGALVKIEQIKPISKLVCWKVTEVLEK